MQNIDLREVAENFASDFFLAIVTETLQALNTVANSKMRVTGICPHCLVNEIVGTLRILDGSATVPVFHAQDAKCWITVEIVRNVPHVLHQKYGQLWAIAFLRSSTLDRDNVYELVNRVTAVNRYSVSTYASCVLNVHYAYIPYLVRNVIQQHKTIDTYDVHMMREWMNAQHEQYTQYEYHLQQAQWTH